MIDPDLLREWLSVQRHQLIRFLMYKKAAHPSQVHFYLSALPFSGGRGSALGSGSSSSSGSGSFGTDRDRDGHIILSKQQIRSISLACIVSDSSFLNLKQAAASSGSLTNKAIPRPKAGPGKRAGTGTETETEKEKEREKDVTSVLTPSQREMRRFVIIHKFLFMGVVDPKAIVSKMPEEVVCSARTIRYYRQRLLDATLLHILCDHFTAGAE
jgi:hypothetical protein